MAFSIAVVLLFFHNIYCRNDFTRCFFVIVLIFVKNITYGGALRAISCQIGGLKLGRVWLYTPSFSPWFGCDLASHCIHRSPSRLRPGKPVADKPCFPVDKSNWPWYILFVVEFAAYNFIYQFHKIKDITNNLPYFSRKRNKNRAFSSFGRKNRLTFWHWQAIL